MPDLPPDLHEEIVRLLCPLAQFRLLKDAWIC